MAARARLLEEYPEWEAWRCQARAIKSLVVSNLDEYLDQLQTQVEGWGGQVLRAADGPAAVALILDLARRHQVRLLVKAKSMTSEEIGLNAALEVGGFRSPRLTWANLSSNWPATPRPTSPPRPCT